MQATFRSSYPHTVISYQQCYTWSCEARKSGYITVFSALGKGGSKQGNGSIKFICSNRAYGEGGVRFGYPL